MSYKMPASYVTRNLPREVKPKVKSSANGVFRLLSVVFLSPVLIGLLAGGIPIGMLFGLGAAGLVSLLIAMALK